MPQEFWFLKNCPLFQQLKDDELRRVESGSRAKKFAAKSPIYLPADESQSVFLLASGRAKICHLTPDGKQSILAFIEPGELFGELALFSDDTTRDEYAEAIDPTTVVRIPADLFSELLANHPAVTLGVTKMIGLRRRRIERRLKNLLFLSNRERLVHLLLELSELYGKRTGDGVELTIKLSHQDLANVIGSTRETVTVVLGELAGERLIRVGRRKVTLLNLERLASSVHTAPPQLPDAQPAPKTIQATG
ncbi:MAG: Crp/Fnr family transcriptional regulator [Pirellulaceae bacterium]|jgi:CRP-like cAMP-binding protein|nr:Crp/Fnr family transcriptional regulator [Pirellulaceae bacterium]